MNYHKDPNHIATIRSKLNDGSRDIILLKEVLMYLRESLEEMALPTVPEDMGGRRLYKVRVLSCCCDGAVLAPMFASTGFASVQRTRNIVSCRVPSPLCRCSACQPCVATSCFGARIW